MLVETTKKLKTIGISLENYKKLNQKRAELSIKLGRAVSFNETIAHLLEGEHAKEG